MRLLAGATARSWQATMNLTLVLEDVEMPPNQIFGVVVTERFGLIVRTTVGFPELIGLSNMKGDQTALGIELAGGDLPFSA